MEELRAKLIERISRTPSVESFRFSLPEKVNFLPGQFLQVIFDEGNRENKELNKYLSLSSSPLKDYIEFTKRISKSIFSQRLLNLKPGDEVLLKMPLGSCVFKEEYQKIAFLIGGIGITPVISIVEYIIDKKLDTDVFLLYSNRTENEIAFKKEFDRWQAINKKIKVFYTVTDCQPKDKTCMFGFIEKDLIKQLAYDLKERTVFIFGPPGMVDTICSITLGLECSRENIKTEKFLGY
ncbi:MAG: FAD-dependent oxidoreductase [Candidatus Omnitrophica bacterium]|jgi:ferredoxin-NADP reductase|nr:FAD-dependent oxidoreductase [Candidatus Omnitrophota bacterium]